MSLGAERKAQDLAQVRKMLEQYRQIELLSVEGDPPERYDFVFHLRGLAGTPTGEPLTTEYHRLQLTLPFGYPHLPPTCKPLSPCFHPNIDPDAVQIGDFWQHDSNLADLVLHLGRMLCGQTFDAREPFNPEAAAWYAAHADELPMDRLEPSQTQTSQPSDSEASQERSADGDLFLDWEQEKEDDSPTVTDEAEELRAAMSQGRYYAARHLLTTLPTGTFLPDRAGLARRIETQIHRAEQNLLAARTNEQSGQIPTALRVLEQLATEIRDVPGLDEEIQRLRHLVPQQSKQERGTPRRGSGTGRVITPVSTGTSKALLTGAGLVVLLLTFGGGGLFLTEQAQQKKASADWQLAQENMRLQHFDEAREAAERGVALLRRLLLPLGQTRILHQRFDELLASRELAEGLKGNLPYQGTFLPRDTISSLEEGQALMNRAEALAGDNRWQEAAALYEQALAALARAGETSGQREQELRLRLARAKLHTLLQGAHNAEKSTNWEEASSRYREASKMARSLDDAIGQADLERRVAVVELQRLLELGRRSLEENNWSASAEHFKQGITLLDAAAAAEPIRQEMQLGLRQSRFGQILAEARLASEAASWEEAVRHYEDALNLLREQPALKVPAEKVARLRQARLLARVAWERQQADEARRQKKPAEEMKHLRRILAEVDRGDVPADSQLRQLRQEAASRAASLEQEELVAKLSRQLHDRFAEIFLENYPSIRSSKLLQPKVTFLSQSGTQLLFHLQCVELNEGRHFRLELKYLYDQATDRWSLAAAGTKQ